MYEGRCDFRTVLYLVEVVFHVALPQTRKVVILSSSSHINAIVNRMMEQRPKWLKVYTSKCDNAGYFCESAISFIIASNISSRLT